MAAENQPSQTPSTTVRPQLLTTLTVGRRTYRKVSRKDRRRRLEYSHPELRLSNRWLTAAGVRPGDRVHVFSPRPGYLVISPAPPRSADQHPNERSQPL